MYEFLMSDGGFTVMILASMLGMLTIGLFTGQAVGRGRRKTTETTVLTFIHGYRPSQSITACHLGWDMFRDMLTKALDLTRAQEIVRVEVSASSVLVVLDGKEPKNVFKP